MSKNGKVHGRNNNVVVHFVEYVINDACRSCTAVLTENRWTTITLAFLFTNNTWSFLRNNIDFSRRVAPVIPNNKRRTTKRTGDRGEYHVSRAQLRRTWRVLTLLLPRRARPSRFIRPITPARRRSVNGHQRMWNFFFFYSQLHAYAFGHNVLRDKRFVYLSLSLLICVSVSAHLHVSLSLSLYLLISVHLRARFLRPSALVCVFITTRIYVSVLLCVSLFLPPPSLFISYRNSNFFLVSTAIPVRLSSRHTPRLSRGRKSFRYDIYSSRYRKNKDNARNRTRRERPNRV